MKASKLITKEQRNQMWGDYILLTMNKLGYTFEQYLTTTIYFKIKQI